MSYDEPFDVTVDGLPAGDTVEVRLSGEDGDGSSFDGRATIETEDGTVSLADATVVSESDDPLDGVVPASLDVPLPIALFQFASPLTNRSYSWPDEQELAYSIEYDGETVGSTSLSRTFPDLSAFVEPEHPELEGAVYEPTNGRTGPGVVVLHGSGGSPLHHRSALLASRGYTAFALHYFGGEGVPADLNEIPIEYVRDAAEWLREYETTSSDRIGLYGASKGGELALLAGSQFDVFDAVVSINGSGLVWEGLTESWQLTDASSWSHGGEPVPYVEIDSWYVDPDSLSEETIGEASIPVEKIDGRVLLVSGGDDTLWPSADLHDVAADRLEEHDHPNFEHLVYEDAGHYISPPYRPAVGLTERGGTHEGAVEASHDHWQSVLETFSTLS
ncbi:acyl-CoA thioester hydrolase/BAAT C-terminal domain-containing protein [Halopiger goleimassiliensis]|uniref:acyl-CoA thioester hydrolase/BAAT C-terminal domain-containing protein n=1 Tax=Halopiger goleimassiliensis TaxID=1293048 RepID=UPI000678347D|nr:acyl-CoA thioester hydrolase/BAAT C-terminal domain-containing protein [Halopiger goleimassiliensis]